MQTGFPIVHDDSTAPANEHFPLVLLTPKQNLKKQPFGCFFFLAPENASGTVDSYIPIMLRSAFARFAQVFLCTP